MRVDIQGMSQRMPWAFSLATAIGLGVKDHRADRIWLWCGRGGALFALGAKRIALALSGPARLPLFRGAYVYRRIKSMAVALVGGSFGWVFTLIVPRPRSALWHEKKQTNPPSRVRKEA